MSYHIFPVQHPALKPYIEALWSINTQIPYGREKILPTATLELIINFGDSFRLIDRKRPEQFIHHTRAWLVGLQTEYLVNEITGYSHMLGIRFKPGGIAPFFPYPASDFHNESVALDAIWGRFADDLREQLYAIPTLAGRMQHIEAALLKRLHADEQLYLPIQFAVQQIQRSGGSMGIKGLSERTGYSQKHLGQQFKRIVGITPKRLARVYRFQQVLRGIQGMEEPNWVEIALTCHYHDQSHFNKEFAAFTGLTPSAYMALRSGYSGSAEDESGHFVPIG